MCRVVLADHWVIHGRQPAGHLYAGGVGGWRNTGMSKHLRVAPEILGRAEEGGGTYLRKGSVRMSKFSY